MKMRWGERETLQFAKSYIRQECLWNHVHPHYKLKHKRMNAYKEIQAEMYETTGIKLSEVEVKIKIKNLRSTYAQELQKIKMRSSAEWTYIPNLKWFHEWHKSLSSLKKNDDGICYDTSSRNYDHEVHETSEEQIWVAPSDHDTSNPFPEQDNDYKLLILKPEPNIPSSPKPETSYKIKKKKFKHRHSSTDSNATYRGSADSGSESNKEDEFDIYGKYIATQLRKMDLQKALRVQLEIQSLVSEARISDSGSH